MRMKYILGLLVIVPMLSACQGEDANPVEQPTPEVPKRVYAVKASLPGDDQTRSHITYGNQNPKEEIFSWHPITEVYDDNDYIYVFNITRLSECPEGIQLNAVRVDGNIADFESVELGGDDRFHINAGDLLFVNYWKTDRKTTDDDREIFTINVGEQSSQLILDNPYEPSYMTYMKGNIKMYDIVTAVEDEKIPDLHFRYLSAIMRVTFRNETGRDFYPKELQFETNDENAPFCPGTLFLSVDPEAADGSGLKVYNYDSKIGESELEGATPYTNIASVGINNYTAAPGAPTGTSIPTGKSYDLYMCAVPRIKNSIKSETLTIRLHDRIDSKNFNTFEMTLEGFNTVIQAGKRYWFNLTAVEEEGKFKLVFTNKWLKDHPEQNKENGE